jgi:hypothetical protein
MAILASKHSTSLCEDVIVSRKTQRRPDGFNTGFAPKPKTHVFIYSRYVQGYLIYRAPFWDIYPIKYYTVMPYGLLALAGTLSYARDRMVGYGPLAKASRSFSISRD